MRAQLLGLLLFASPGALLRLTAAFGGHDGPGEPERLVGTLLAFWLLFDKPVIQTRPHLVTATAPASQSAW